MKTLIGFTVFRRTVHGARRWDRLSLGVANGLKAWLWYGVAEYVLCSIVPVLFWPYAVVATAQWRATAELLACYGIIGATLGVGSALSVDHFTQVPIRDTPATFVTGRVALHPGDSYRATVYTPRPTTREMLRRSWPRHAPTDWCPS